MADLAAHPVIGAPRGQDVAGHGVLEIGRQLRFGGRETG